MFTQTNTNGVRMQKELFTKKDLENGLDLAVTSYFDTIYNDGYFLKVLKLFTQKKSLGVDGADCTFGDMDDFDAETNFEGVEFAYGYDLEESVIVSEEVCYQYVRLASERYIALHPEDAYKVNTLLEIMPYSTINIQKKYREALEYYKYDLACYQKAADQNLAEAQNDLGVMYAKSYGVEQDFQKAFDLFQKAADQNLAEAQYNLGVMYEKGHGVEQDFQKSFKYYQKAADQNLAEAQFNLGVMYQKGHGVEQDFQKSFKYYQKAADQNLPEAQYNLSIMYFNGFGIERDPKKGMEYQTKAEGQNFCVYELYSNTQITHGISKDYQKTKKYYQL